MANLGLELCEAVADGDHEHVRKLLHKKKVNVNSRDECNWTPLMIASYNGDEACMMLILTTAGVDVNAFDNSGTTAFMNVALSGNIEAVKLLLAAPGIDIKQKDNQGKIALDYAKERGVTDVFDLMHKETSLAVKIFNKAARVSQRITLSRFGKPKEEKKTPMNKIIE